MKLEEKEKPPIFWLDISTEMVFIASQIQVFSEQICLYVLACLNGLAIGRAIYYSIPNGRVRTATGQPAVGASCLSTFSWLRILHPSSSCQLLGYDRNTLWLHNMVRQTSRGKSAAAGLTAGWPQLLTSRRMSAWPYRVTTKYSFHPVRTYKMLNQRSLRCALKWEIQWFDGELYLTSITNPIVEIRRSLTTVLSPQWDFLYW